MRLDASYDLQVVRLHYCDFHLSAVADTGGIPPLTLWMSVSGAGRLLPEHPVT